MIRADTVADLRRQGWKVGQPHEKWGAFMYADAVDPEGVERLLEIDIETMEIHHAEPRR